MDIVIKPEDRKLQSEYSSDSDIEWMAEPIPDPVQKELFADHFPARAASYPQLRFMGSKQRLLPWIHRIVSPLQFDRVLDAFSGSGCVAYLFKAMGKEVVTNDSLNLSATISRALIENSSVTLSDADVELLTTYDPGHKRFIERTFSGIF